MPKRLNPNRRIAIIGSGFSGLCAAIHLKKRGFENFTIFEKADAVGGTWRENTYPGAECDTPSVLYSYSFEPNPDWTNKWSEQPEILAYIERCADKYGIRKHIQFRQLVTALRFDDSAGEWELQTDDGTTKRFDVVISGLGQLHKPLIPDLPGAESFQGAAFHSAKWNHAIPLEGKRIACVGNAASAVQFIPQIAPKAGHLTVFQRNPNWIVPKNDRPYSEFEKALFRRVPPVQQVQRFWNWFRGEGLLYPLMWNRFAWFRNFNQRTAIKYMEEKVADPALRKKLVPNYPMGAKRILFSDDYYDALVRNNVSVVTEPIDRIEPLGILTTDGRMHNADVIIYATGFETNTFLTPMKVEGLNGQCLNEKWASEGAEAYLGITHTGFPNFFMMYGPNTNLGHNSIIVMIEAQTRYIMSCLAELDARGSKWLDVKESVQSAYNANARERLKQSIWAQVDHSWYKDANGKITNNWTGRTTEYRRRTRTMNPAEFNFVV